MLTCTLATPSTLITDTLAHDPLNVLFNTPLGPLTITVFLSNSTLTPSSIFMYSSV